MSINLCLYAVITTWLNVFPEMHNDITLNMDTGKVIALTLLDLSAAFDTINYTVLMDRLYL